MSTPQGMFSFNGIEGLVSAQFALGHGITPSRASMYVVPAAATLGKLKAVGTLLLTYGDITITFPDCKCADIGFEIQRDGRELWNLTIFDTRWRWRYPRLSGEYNVRTADQQIKDQPKVKLRTKKTARELVKILIDALKLKNVDLKNVPEDSFPEVKWDYERADKALGDLCDMYSLRVALGPNNAVSIDKQGEGAELPKTADAVDNSLGVEPAERPAEIVFVGAPDIYQADFELTPVAREKNGDWVPLDQVSYTPKNGTKWRAIDIPNYQSITDYRSRELAKQSVFRAYQIKTPFNLPEVKNAVDFLWRILPIHNTQLEKANVDNQLQELPPWVYGVYYEGHARMTTNEEFAARERLGDTTTYPNGIWTRGFDVDTEHGVVIMSEPVYRTVAWGGQTIGFALEPAALFLRIAVSLRDPTTNAFIHREFPRRLGNKNVDTDPLIVQNNEISFKAAFERKNGKQIITSNVDEWEATAEHYLDAEEKRLDINTPGGISWAGFKKIKPDGAINQVVWSVGDDGRAFTRASRNNERDIVDLPYKERRLEEKLGKALAQLQKQGRGPLGPWLRD